MHPEPRSQASAVDEISADAPFGTVEGFTRAAEYLEGFEVYALAPLTHDQTVAQVFKTHVDFMSEPENKGERIVLWNPETPTTALDTLVGSGTDGDGLTTTTFDTKIATLAALVQNAGVTPTGTIPVSAGLYLDIASDSKRYSIKSLSGSQIVLRTAPGDFAAGGERRRLLCRDRSHPAAHQRDLRRACAGRSLAHPDGGSRTRAPLRRPCSRSGRPSWTAGSG